MNTFSAVAYVAALGTAIAGGGPDARPSPTPDPRIRRTPAEAQDAIDRAEAKRRRKAASRRSGEQHPCVARPHDYGACMTTPKTKRKPVPTVGETRAYYSGLVAKAQQDRADGLEIAVNALACELDDARASAPDRLTSDHRDMIRSQALAMLSADTRIGAATAGLAVFVGTGEPYISAALDRAIDGAVGTIRRAGKGIGRMFDDPGARAAFIASFLSSFAASSGIDISAMMGDPPPVGTDAGPPASPAAEPGTAKPASPIATPGTAKPATGVAAKKRAPKSK